MRHNRSESQPIGVTGNGPKALHTMHECSSQSQSQSHRERTHEGYACIERSKTEGIKQRAGHRPKVHATAHGPEPPNATAKCHNKKIKSLWTQPPFVASHLLFDVGPVDL
eukprot:353223-Chlamydomonas_euryale.AAC.3